MDILLAAVESQSASAGTETSRPLDASSVGSSDGVVDDTTTVASSADSARGVVSTGQPAPTKG